jgi:membrane protein
MFSQYYQKIHTLIASALVPTSSAQIMTWIDSFIANASQMGYIGALYVIVAAVLFFKDFDYIVNDIFDDKRRSFLEALIVYGALLISIPLILVGSIWGLMKLDSQFHFGPFVLQFILVWGIIFIIYKISPKEKIPLNVLALSSFVTTVVWYIAKSIFVFYILYNKTYTTIYGTVSLVLFTFLWIYISWTIFLHGLQLCKMLLDEE